MAPQVQAKKVEQVQTAPNYIQAAKQNEDAVLSAIESNPIYKFIIEDDTAPHEQRITNVLNYLMAGLQDGTAKETDIDDRRKALTEFNAFVQVIRKQLGSEQAKEITSKAYADFQRIVNDTTEDVSRFQAELAPLGQLADLFTKYGADGNIIEKINLAKDQKRIRERNLQSWTWEHEGRVTAAKRSVATAEANLSEDQEALAGAWFGKGAIEKRIENAEKKLTDAKTELAKVEAEQPELTPMGEIEQVDEGILELQNIGGPAFKKAVSDLRDHTEEALAKISSNFDEAIEGLTNTRASFITMDRNCSDANMALSVLEKAVQSAEAQSRDIAQGLLKQQQEGTGDLAELEKMERERRSGLILSYTGSLTTFLKDVGVAVASLRSGQAVIQNILRMNALALESANTHKITGIANTADAVTIIIGSIIEVCNRAASQALADGLIKIRAMAEDGANRLATGTYESLKQQNEQLSNFVESVQSLKDMTKDITANSVDLLKEQFALVNQMREESAALATSTDEAQRMSFEARAGVSTTTTAKPKTDAPRMVGLKVRDNA